MTVSHYSQRTQRGYSSSHPYSRSDTPLRRSTVDQKCIEINKKIIGLREASDFFAIWDRSQNNFNCVNLATFMNRLSKQKIFKDTRKELSLVVDEVAKKLLSNDTDRLKECTTQHLADLVNGYAKLGIEKRALFDAISDELLARKSEKLKKCTTQELANLVNGYAKLGIEKRALFDAISDELLARKSEKLKECNTQDLANIAWAYAMLAFLNGQLFSSILSQLNEQIQKNKNTFEREALQQIQQVWLSMKYESYEPSVSHLTWSPELVKACSLVEKDEHISQLQKDVYTALKKNEDIEEEKNINGLVVDIAFKNKKCVIEVNGPSHYLDNTHDLNSKSKFKYRLLEKMGYTVTEIPYWEWAKLKNAQEKVEYMLREHLKSSTKAKNALQAASLQKQPLEALPQESGKREKIEATTAAYELEDGEILES